MMKAHEIKNLYWTAEQMSSEFSNYLQLQVEMG